jgi:hypothetical protein
VHCTSQTYSTRPLNLPSTSAPPTSTVSSSLQRHQHITHTTKLSTPEPTNDPYIAKRDEQTTKSLIAALLSDADHKEYTRLCDGFKKNNRQDDADRMRRQHQVRTAIHRFLEERPQLVVLHNRVARLQVVAGRKSPLPVFSELEPEGVEDVVRGLSEELKKRTGRKGGDGVGLSFGGGVAVRPGPSTPVGRSPGINKTPSTRKAPHARKILPKHQRLHTSKPQGNRLSDPAPALQQQTAPPTIHLPPQYWNATFECYELPIQNPDAFPTHLITNLHNAQLTDMEECRDASGAIENFSATILNHPHFDCLSICVYAPALLAAIGIQHSNPCVLSPLPSTPLPHAQLKLVTIESLRPASTAEREAHPIPARLEFVRHAYLWWLEMRGVEFPVEAPTKREIEMLAQRLGLFAEDVRGRLMEWWHLERYGENAEWYRRNREITFGGRPHFRAHVG